MGKFTRFGISPMLLVTVVGLSLAAPVLAGPPWISIELPANPYDKATRGAFLVVHTYHHGNAGRAGVGGSAEGLVDGKRRTIRLTFDSTLRSGSYALKKQWPSEGTWTLIIRSPAGSRDGATAIVDLGSSGEVSAVRVPTTMREGWVIPQPVAMAEIEASLRARAAQHLAGRTGT
jgi:hypothetical protein